MNTEKVTTVVVIDHEIPEADPQYGRAFLHWDENIKGKVSVVLQDEGRTLKVIISEHLTKQIAEELRKLK